MESSAKNVHTKQKQFEIMVEFMCAHPDLAKGRLNASDARNTSNNLWERLSSSLNAEGPPMRDGVGWKKVWADYKGHVKIKLRKNKMSISGTGGGPSKFCSFTPMEEEVITLLNLNESVDGVPSARVFGAQNAEPTPTNSQDTVRSDENIQHQETEERRAVPRYTPRNKENLLQKQVENQMDYHKNQIEYQEKSYRIFREINENLKSIARYEKKKYELKEKKYKLAKDKFEHKKRIDYEKSQLKLSKLELKREMFQLQSSGV